MTQPDDDMMIDARDPERHDKETLCPRVYFVVSDLLPQDIPNNQNNLSSEVSMLCGN